jgi:hypothetical protein
MSEIRAYWNRDLDAKVLVATHIYRTGDTKPPGSKLHVGGGVRSGRGSHSWRERREGSGRDGVRSCVWTETGHCGQGVYPGSGRR